MDNTAMHTVMNITIYGAGFLVMAFCIWKAIKNKGKISVRGAFGAGFIVMLVLVVVFILVELLMAQTQSAAELELTPVTAENTPVNLFLMLDEELSVEDIRAMGREKGWFISGMEPDARNLTVTLDSRYSFNLDEANGVVLRLTYGEEGELLAAELTIKTDDGTAACFYYPTEYTEWGRDTGLTVTVQKHWYTLKRTYHPDSLQEAVDIAYAVVYPDGL